MKKAAVMALGISILLMTSNAAAEQQADWNSSIKTFASEESFDNPYNYFDSGAETQAKLNPRESRELANYLEQYSGGGMVASISSFRGILFLDVVNLQGELLMRQALLEIDIEFSKGLYKSLLSAVDGNGEVISANPHISTDDEK